MSISLDEARNFFAAKQLQDIKAINIFFDGAGDSGDITEIVYYIDDHDAVLEKPISSEFELITDIFYTFFNDSIGDWYNNDGGYGTVIIHLEDGSWELEANYRTVETETAEGTFLDLKE